MTDSQESLRMEYEAILGRLELIANDLKTWLAEACRQLGIYMPRIDVRAKEPHSYLTKIVRRAVDGRPFTKPLREVTDKVGARADLIYARDVDRLVSLIRSASGVFEPVSDADIDDRREHDEEHVGYSGVHVDIVPLQLHGLHRSVGRCEIQVRTNAQAAWAMASHELVYKPLIHLPRQVRRNVNRLTTLLELFDEQVAIAHQTMTESKDYPLAVVIHALRSVRFRFLGSDYDDTLTRMLVSLLVDVDDADEARALASRIEVYGNERETALREVISGLRPALVGQPETILIFMRLDEDMLGLQNDWIAAGLDHKLLRDLAGAWAVALPDPL